MKNAAYSFRRLSGWLVMILLLGSIPLAGQGRFQLEIYGGFSWLNPRDLNLLPKAEEQYTGLLFVERYLGWDGYFINDFPRITTALPAGIRLKYRLSGKLAVSLEAEGFWRTREEILSGSFTYAPSWSLTEAKDYSPYRLSLRGISVM
jgi:hypothetical protein